ncbi:MAG: DNA primase [Candidatus Saccharimonadales bacterium]
MQDAKEEVRARLNIEDVIGEYVQLKRAGRSFKGLSPFSGEKTPSFFVSPDKHIWHDFSSNKGGDIFAFVMEVEGMDFRQALEHLARKAGVDLSLYQSKGNQQLAERKKRLVAANDLAATYYQQSLLRNTHALEYVFKKRGLNKNVVTDFRIGYAPTTGDALVQFLTKKGFSSKELSESGLTNRFGGDLFRGRMMIPLMDGTGQVIGFTARVVNDGDTKAPKYLNTPETLLYNKSRHVFGLSQAKEAIRAHDYSVIVEGNLDVVSSHQAGVCNVVATAGTAMTEHHLRALVRLSGSVRLAFDGDKAGVAATERAIPIAQEAGVDMTVVSLPSGAKDPDELIKQDVALWQQALDAAVPVVEWVIGQYAAREDMSTAAGKRAFTTAGLAVVRALRDPVEQEFYLKEISERADVSLETLQRKLVQSAAAAEQPKPLKRTNISSRSEPAQRDKNVDALFTVALQDAGIQELFGVLDPAIFATDAQVALAQYIIQHTGEAVQEIPGHLREYEKYVTMVLLNPDIDKLEWSEQHRIDTARDVIRSLQANYQKTETKEDLIRKEAEARARGDEVVADTILMQINQIIRGEK